jgi:hypothetical protein
MPVIILADSEINYFSAEATPTAGTHYQQGGPEMLTFLNGDRARYCDGMSRRSFLKAGTLALGGLALPDFLRLSAPVEFSHLRAVCTATNSYLEVRLTATDRFAQQIAETLRAQFPDLIAP